MSALAASPLVLDRTPRMMRLAPLATILMVASKPMPEFFVDVSAAVLRTPFHVNLTAPVMMTVLPVKSMS
jgi:hypothetical protein